MDRIRGFLLSYKKSFFARFLVILVLSYALSYLMLDGFHDFPMMFCLVAGMEYMTINILYEMDFPPVRLFAVQAFGSRESRGYQVTYWLFYTSWWVFVIIALIEESTGVRLLGSS